MEQRERWEDPQEALSAALDGRQATMWTAMPGIVAKVSGNNVSVNPAIKSREVTPKGKFSDVALPQLINVPLVMPGGGGFGITIPIAVGDEVLVVFSSRCIDGWWQHGGIQPQVEYRMHDLSDGFAIPAPMSNPKAFSGISSSSLQIRTADASCYFEVAPSGVVNIVAPGGVAITGNLTVTGEITAGQGTGDSVTLQQHTHGGVSTGSGISGVPTPGT